MGYGIEGIGARTPGTSLAHRYPVPDSPSLGNSALTLYGLFHCVFYNIQCAIFDSDACAQSHDQRPAPEQCQTRDLESMP